MTPSTVLLSSGRVVGNPSMGRLCSPLIPPLRLKAADHPISNPKWCNFRMEDHSREMRLFQHILWPKG
jgi:hypothetical protein